MSKRALTMWMVKDPKGSILPMYCIWFTRKGAIGRLTNEGLHSWKDLQLWGWKVVKVKITEHVTERTDNKA
jgi:hypothetical protein